MQSVQVKFDYPAKLSRGILLLRTFFGAIYVGIPHMFCLFFVSIAAGFVSFLSWWAVLFTGKYPRSFFDFMVGYHDWTLRVSAYMAMLTDQYPEFGLKADYPAKFTVACPEKLSRGLLLLRTFFGSIYVMIPHMFCLYFRLIGYTFVAFVAWWAILFTGKMPESMFSYISGTYRWQMRVNAYVLFLTDEYPPFSGKDGVGGVAAGTGVPA